MILLKLYVKLQSLIFNTSLFLQDELEVDEEYVPDESIEDGGGFFLVALG